MWLNQGESLASAESAVSNNSTMGNIPHQTGQLSCPPTPDPNPQPYHPSPDTFTPWPCNWKLHVGIQVGNSPHIESNKRRRFAGVVLQLFCLLPIEGLDAKFGFDKPHADPGRAYSEHRALLHMQAPKLLPLLQPESDYRQAWGQAGHWKHRHEQTIRYYLKESSAFQRKMVPLQCHVDDRILNLTLNQPFKKNEHCHSFMPTR